MSQPPVGISRQTLPPISSRGGTPSPRSHIPPQTELSSAAPLLSRPICPPPKIENVHSIDTRPSGSWPQSQPDAATSEGVLSRAWTWTKHCVRTTGRFLKNLAPGFLASAAATTITVFSLPKSSAADSSSHAPGKDIQVHPGFELTSYSGNATCSASNNRTNASSGPSVYAPPSSLGRKINNLTFSPRNLETLFIHAGSFADINAASFFADSTLDLSLQNNPSWCTVLPNSTMVRCTPLSGNQGDPILVTLVGKRNGVPVETHDIYLQAVNDPPQSGPPIEIPCFVGQPLPLLQAGDIAIDPNGDVLSIKWNLVTGLPDGISTGVNGPSGNVAAGTENQEFTATIWVSDNSPNDPRVAPVMVTYRIQNRDLIPDPSAPALPTTLSGFVGTPGSDPMSEFATDPDGRIPTYRAIPEPGSTLPTSFSVEPDGSVEWTLQPDDPKTFSFRVEASDGVGSTLIRPPSTEPAIVFTTTNRAPIVPALASQDLLPIKVGETRILPFKPYDLDGDLFTVAITCNGGSCPIFVKLDGPRIQIKPQSGNQGPLHVSYTVSDGKLSTSTLLSLEIANQKPYLDPPLSQLLSTWFKVGDTVNRVLPVRDDDQDLVAATCVSCPPGTSVLSNILFGSVASGLEDPLHPTNITLRLYDGTESVLVSAPLLVENQAPIWSGTVGIPLLTINHPAVKIMLGTLSCQDPEGGPTTLLMGATPSGITVVAAVDWSYITLQALPGSQGDKAVEVTCRDRFSKAASKFLALTADDRAPTCVPLEISAPVGIETSLPLPASDADGDPTTVEATGTGGRLPGFAKQRGSTLVMTPTIATQTQTLSYVAKNAKTSAPCSIRVTVVRPSLPSGATLKVGQPLNMPLSPKQFTFGNETFSVGFSKHDLSPDFLSLLMSRLSGTPGRAHRGTHFYELMAKTMEGLTYTVPYTVVVENQLPTARNSTVSLTTSTQNTESFSLREFVSDEDDPTDALFFDTDTTITKASLSANGDLRFFLSPEDAGSRITLPITVTDPLGKSVQFNVVARVTALGIRITGTIDSQTLPTGVANFITADLFEDEDLGELNYGLTVNGQPAALPFVFDTNRGTLAVTFPEGSESIGFNCTVTASRVKNGIPVSASQSFTLTPEAPDSPWDWQTIFGLCSMGCAMVMTTITSIVKCRKKPTKTPILPLELTPLPTSTTTTSQLSPPTTPASPSQQEALAAPPSPLPPARPQVRRSLVEFIHGRPIPEGVDPRVLQQQQAMERAILNWDIRQQQAAASHRDLDYRRALARAQGQTPPPPPPLTFLALPPNRQLDVVRYTRARLEPNGSSPLSTHSISPNQPQSTPNDVEPRVPQTKRPFFTLTPAVQLRVLKALRQKRVSRQPQPNAGTPTSTQATPSSPGLPEPDALPLLDG